MLLYCMSTRILFRDWEYSSHEVDAIQTVKHKVWQGNDSNRLELVQQFPTTVQHITSHQHSNFDWPSTKPDRLFVECGTTI